jgi:pimeloyl-ACP methyl ester carboxylesterase
MAYVQAAASSLAHARKALGPSYAIVVTGHSLGGLVALALDAIEGVQDLDYQVVALEPTPFGQVLRDIAGSELASLDTSRRYAIYDPYDLSSSSFAPAVVLRPMTTLCVYNESLLDLPQSCQDCIAEAQSSATTLSFDEALSQCFHEPVDPDLHYAKCKDGVHFVERYAKDLIPLKSSNGTC